MTTGLQLGRPGVYLAPPRPSDRLQAVRLDIAGFVGVALRGPTDTPVLVTSWSDYEQTFGAFERGAGVPDRLLPYAVNAFFAQGGERAYVLRLAPGPRFAGPTAGQATARFVLDGRPGFELTAASEGTWGSSLRLRLDFEVARSFGAAEPAGRRLALPPGTNPADLSVVRVRRPGLPGTGVLRVLTRLADPALRDRFGDLDEALPEAPHDADGVEVDIVTGTLVVDDPSSVVPRGERIRGLGLVPGHERFVASVLADGSALCRTAGTWGPLRPDAYLSPVTATRTQEGVDRSWGIDAESLFDPGDADADLLDEWEDHRGVDRMGRVPDLGLLVVPDLCWRAEPARPEPVSGPRPPPPRSHCDLCLTAAEPELTPPAPVPTGLDARAPADLAEIVRRQRRVVEVAVLRHRFVALLDVPRALPVRQVTAWRARFDTAYAAAYHPWLGVTAAPAPSAVAVDVPPSAFAAGIIAARERAHGVAWGPANELAHGAVVSREAVTDSLHDQLHLLGVNVFRAERDGFRLTAARTMSSDLQYRQLSVRRLMTQLAETLTRQCQWLVFEPNTVELRTRLTSSITDLLRGLQRSGALAGRTEEESFFVRCDDSTNPPSGQALGRLVAEVGVAPAAPLEYLVLRLSADLQGDIRVEEPHA